MSPSKRARRSRSTAKAEPEIVSPPELMPLGPAGRSFRVLCYRLDPIEYGHDEDGIDQNAVSERLTRDVQEIAESTKAIITTCGASYHNGYLVVTVEWWKR